ncbi:FMT1 [Candida pseudojiufengensis]|uniref:FMT1 n=1 Tax=Candida pseudojiufengensis TaxID=497109 RepID=UPI0022259BA0|nr:FMT1 [Candida pseudojiufengensis]KAI5965823.1 FMT1 [Candida pseudojiufengensis]
MIQPIYRSRLFNSIRTISTTSTTAIRHDPLKIAFFGSDKFSVASLRKLLDLKSSTNEVIEDIKVITRTIKPTGRYMKKYEELPISKYALENKIPVLRADSSQDILKLLDNNTFNLTIAVSFGKLIPSKFLESCTYGGLNVHPSLLPKYSGSSPIQHAIMNDDQTTGVTVQTLHPTKFDHGRIISQSDEVPILNDNYRSLEYRLGAEGGELLKTCIKDSLFVEPQGIESSFKRSFAPKIDKTKRQILWNQYSARQIERLNDALGPLFTFIKVQTKSKGKLSQEIKRVILDRVKETKNENELWNLNLKQPGEFYLSEDKLYIKANNGYLTVGKLKLQTKSEETPVEFMKNYKKNIGKMPQKFVETEQNK